MEELPVPTTDKQNEKTYRHKSKTLLFLLGAMIILAIGFLGGYLVRGSIIQGNKNQKNNIKNAKLQSVNSQRLPVTPTINSQPSPIASVSLTQKQKNEQEIYVNKAYGFTMTYPKFDQYGDSCTPRKNNIIPYKIYVDPSSNSIYIADASFAEKPMKLIPNEKGYTWDPANCKMVTNSLHLIKNGYTNGMPSPSNIALPQSFQITYAKINKKQDLNNLAHAMFGNGCFAGNQTPNKNQKGVYDVHLVDSTGKPTPWGGQKNALSGGCLTNFVYIFHYVPTLKVAIITQGFQNGPLSGTNNQSVPTFTFSN